MKVLQAGCKLFVAALLVSVLAPRQAFAYIDPVSGSIILQVLAAGLLAASLTHKRWRAWVGRTVRGMISRRRS